MHAHGPHVAADGGGHPPHQPGIERGGPGDGGGVDGGAVGGEAGQALLVDDRRDAQPGRLDDGPLEPDDLGRSLGGGERDAAVDPGEVAQAVADGLVERDGA